MKTKQRNLRVGCLELLSAYLYKRDITEMKVNRTPLLDVC